MFYVLDNIHRTCKVIEFFEEFYPSKKGRAECQSHCSRLNVSYVKFLNKIVNQLGEKFFSDISIIKLNPIDADVGECVHNKEKNTYDCDCKIKYQVTIRSDFSETLCGIRSLPYSPSYFRLIDYFISVLFFLTFHPDTVVLYIAFLFCNHKFRCTENAQPAIYSDLSFVPPNVYGAVQKIISCTNGHDKLFEKIVTVTKFKELDINIFADAFHEVIYSDDFTLM